MDHPAYDMGMVGLGVMGHNLVLNMADHGYAIAGYDKESSQVQSLQTEAGRGDIRGAQSIEEFIGLLCRPRVVMLMLPAGAPVDAVIRDILPYLEPGDLIVDGGNSHFRDTDLRAKALAARGILYLGVGISGGERGARHGPSLMPGGPQEAYERVRPVFEAIAARAGDEPCVTYLGPGSAGHYVKMVHNGIEYGLMQLIAETYDLMKRGLGLTDDELHSVYAQWDSRELNAYLIEIAADIFLQVDDRTGKRLVDVIVDVARQKGTGAWASQDAMQLQVPVPTIDIAVAMRNLSILDPERTEASRVLKGPQYTLPKGWRGSFVDQLRNALHAAMVITYAQGMALLSKASQAYGYNLNLEDVARIWRAGCIIRAAVLEDIHAAYHARPELPNLLLDPDLGQTVMERQADLRTVVESASEIGIPAPGFMVSLAYFDGYRSAWLPANLIQAQRDYFGAHTYERVDARGTFHTQWEHQEEGVP
jgi:6-phosphogluconate dehydrogenase